MIAKCSNIEWDWAEGDGKRDDMEYHKIWIKTSIPVYALTRISLIFFEQWIVSSHVALFSNAFNLSDHSRIFFFGGDEQNLAKNQAKMADEKYLYI